MRNRKLQTSVGVLILLAGIAVVCLFDIYSGTSIETSERRRVDDARISALLPTLSAPTTSKTAPIEHQGPQFVTCLARESLGSIWVGSEGQGIYRLSPQNHTWVGYTQKDGLGDDYAYAIAVDHQGRVWAGHLNHGVSVYNGDRWTNFDILDAPVGPRVFSIAVSPLDGDIWIASNAGLTRYSPAKDGWRLYTRASGLPSNYLSAVAVDTNGDVYVGTDCNGIAIGRAAEGFLKWFITPGPQSIPRQTTGEGLPCSCINAICVAENGAVYAGTTSGVAFSNNRGASWRYIRGLDTVITPEVTGNKRWDPTLLLEDYVVCVADAGPGKVCVGHRRRGWEVFDVMAGRRVAAAPGKYATTFARAVFTDRGQVFAGIASGLVEPQLSARQPETLQNTVVPTPSRSSIETIGDLQAMRSALTLILPLQLDAGRAISLNDDWRTEGTWVGRYGRYWACLAAMLPYGDYVWQPGSGQVDLALDLGPNHHANDSVRRFVAALKTADPRVLEMHPVYYDSRVKLGLAKADERLTRRRSMWDDHGEVYADDFEGPDLKLSIGVPAGIFYLSLYETNQAREGRDAIRDYSILVSTAAESTHTMNSPLDSSSVRARMRYFWSGVYKRFLVRGPANYDVYLQRAGSRNVTLSGVMLDTFCEEPPPYYPGDDFFADSDAYEQNLLRPWKEIDKYARGAAVSSDIAAELVFQRLEQLKTMNPTWWAMESWSFYRALACYYSTGRSSGPQALQSVSRLRRLGVCYMNLGLYDKWEECRKQSGLKTIREIEQSLKWDGVTNEYRGKEDAIIRAAVSSMSQ